MKKKFFTILFLVICFYATAQSNLKIDSLKIVCKLSKPDTNQVIILRQIAQEYYNILEDDSALAYTKIGLHLSRNLKYDRGTISHLINLSSCYVRKQNQSKALIMILEAYNISEEKGLIQESLKALIGISLVYSSFNNYSEAIKYKLLYLKKYKKLMGDTEYLKNNREKLVVDSLNISRAFANISSCFLNLNKLDSALLYSNLALNLVNRISRKDPIELAFTLNCLSKVYFKLGESERALLSYKKSIEQSLASNNKRLRTGNLSMSYLGIAKIFTKFKQLDSANYYAEKALLCCQQIKNANNLIEIQSLLAKNYTGIDDSKAVYYYQQSSILRDSLYNKEKIEQLQNITFNEQERQKELEEQRKIQEENRNRRIEYSLIALGILSIIFIFLFLSNSIVTSDKINRFFAALALLMVFEFFNLIAGLFIGNITANIPTFSFLAAVCLALSLSPLHGKLDKFLTKKMVEKRKRIKAKL